MITNACGFGLPNTKMISTAVYNAINIASSQTGVDNAMMLAIADLVSGFDETLVTGNGTGLYQFPQSLWSEMIQQYGYLYMIPDLFDSITNPLYNAYFGAQLILDILDLLPDRYGIISPTTGQVYILFLMGITSGTKFIVEYQRNPSALVSPIFPSIASQNKTIFLNQDGSSKTLLQVYNYLVNLGNTKATAYANQLTLPAPCLRGNGVSGNLTTIANTPLKVTSISNARLSLDGGWISGTTSIDSAALVQSINKLPATSGWFQGAGNLILDPPPIGTAIATFELNGTYGNLSDISHTGIYLGPSDDGSGIKVLDQRGVSLEHPNGLAAAIRDIPGDPSKGYINYAKSYSVINISE